MNADLTPERLAKFIEIADPVWVDAQIKKYEVFRESNAPDGFWSHRPPTMSPVIPLIYWSSREPYEPTNEPYVGYWSGEPKSILGRLVIKILDFQRYWESLPKNRGLDNLRWFLRTPKRFASFEHEISVASLYDLRTPYDVEPCFFDPSGSKGEPDIILRKGDKTFNVQCKSMDPTTSAYLSYELFSYLLGRLGRLSQDYDVHSYLAIYINENVESTASRNDIDKIVGYIREKLEEKQSVLGSQAFQGGTFTFHYEPSKRRQPSHLSDNFIMWTGKILFDERRSFPSRLEKSHKLTVVCKVNGGKFPSFDSYIYPRLEKAAKDADKSNPLIITVHLYPPMFIHDYVKNPWIQNKVVPDLGKFFDRNRHVCLVLISSNPQQPFLVGDNKQSVATPAWELKSQFWKGERPDYYPSA